MVDNLWKISDQVHQNHMINMKNRTETVEEDNILIIKKENNVDLIEDYINYKCFLDKDKIMKILLRKQWV